MVIATNVRPGRLWRTLLGLQSAKGTAVSNFTSAAQVWARETTADFVTPQRDPEWWFNYHNGDFMNARYGDNELNQGVFGGHATPTLLSYALQSLFGTYSGSAFTLVGYVNKWLTLGCVEDKTLVNTSLRFMRFKDTLVNQLTLEVDGTGNAELICRYASEDMDGSTLAAVSGLGVTLPTAPMDSTDRSVFAGRTTTLWRDPLGANVQVPFEKLSVMLDVNLDEYWDMMGRRTRAIRRGPLTTSIMVHGKVGDEYWQAALDANAGTKQAYRLICTEPVTGHVLTMTFYKVSFSAEPYGVKDQAYEPMALHGMATQDLSANFVSISLT